MISGRYNLTPNGLVYGMLVGQVNLIACRASIPEDSHLACLPMEDPTGFWSWELANPVRFDAPVPVTHLPFGPWFYPFQRKKGQSSTPSVT